MVKKDLKTELFESFSVCTAEALSQMETHFEVRGLQEQVFGPEGRWGKDAEERLRQSNAWITLMRLYDFAMDGVTQGLEKMSLVLDAAEVLALATTESHCPIHEWKQLVAMGDGRFALDEGDPVSLEKVALLAKVDVRTVRNAISSGDLIAEKNDGQIYVENASARRWLLGRKGFKPTTADTNSINLSLEDVNSAVDFGAFLLHQRERIGLKDSTQKVTIFHPSASADTLEQLEAGVFALPLDAVFPIADFYQLSRKAFLECVMRVFFSEELEVLTTTHDA